VLPLNSKASKNIQQFLHVKQMESSSEEEVTLRRSSSTRQAAKKTQSFAIDSEGSDDVPVKAKPKASPKVKASAPKRGSKAAATSEDEEDQQTGEQEVKSKQNKVRTAKEELISELLCRWWYVLPEWPSKDFNFNTELRRRGLRLVDLDDWEDAKDVVDGFGKCYGLSQFPGVFRDAKAVLHDCRPEEGKPSFNNMNKYSEKELKDMVKTAYVNQLTALGQTDAELAKNLKTRINQLK
jgi:hypothetical protein